MRRGFKVGAVWSAVLLLLVMSACRPDRGAGGGGTTAVSASFGSLSPYAEAENWVIRQNNVPVENTDFDVFYVYPTLVADRDKPLMDWQDPKVAAKTVGFVRAQTVELFGSQARVFAPYVRQQEYYRCLDYLDHPDAEGAADGLAPGIADTVEALRYYLKHDHTPGRPFILLGHSQGAVDLYEALKQCREITPESGFVAAYLLGMPRLTAEQIRSDFKSRGIVPAENETGTGVIAVWNTQNAGAENPRFTIPGGYVINPLNWRTDAVPAGAGLNRGAVFYDYKAEHSDAAPKEIPHFCGARVDPERGALIVDLPADSRYDAHGFMGRGVFHMNDLWFFAINIRENAAKRVAGYLHSKRDLPAVSAE